MAVMTLIEAVRTTLVEEMRRDESIVVLGEDVGKKGGVFLATDGLYDDRFVAAHLLDQRRADGLDQRHHRHR